MRGRQELLGDNERCTWRTHTRSSQRIPHVLFISTSYSEYEMSSVSTFGKH